MKASLYDPIVHPSTPLQRIAGPAGAYLEAHGRKLAEAWEAGKAGKPLEAVLSGIESTPILGDLTQAFESVAEPLAEGKPRQALGRALGLAALAGAPRSIPAMARGSVRAAEAATAVGSRLPTAVAAAAKAAAPDVALGTIKAGTGAAIGEALGEVPGMGHVARWVFAYPGARQMASGVGKGAEALWKGLRPKVLDAKLAELGGDEAAVAAADSALLEDIWKGGGGKGKLANASPEEQAAVRRIADKLKGAPAPEVSPEAAATPGMTIPETPAAEPRGTSPAESVVPPGPPAAVAAPPEIPQPPLTEAARQQRVLEATKPGTRLGVSASGRMEEQPVWPYRPLPGPGLPTSEELLARKAGQFGIDPKQVEGMRQPVLVRRIADSELEKPEARQEAITKFNRVGTAEMRESERAVADSRRVSSATLDDIAGRLEAEGPEGTLSQVLQGRQGTEVLNKLIEDGVISPHERAAYAEGDALTKPGKERISKLLLARFFRDPAQLDTIPTSIKNKIERIAAPLVRTEAVPEWSLTPKLQEAIDLLEEARAHGATNLENFLKQSGLFTQQQYGPQAVALAKALQGSSGTELSKLVSGYAQDAQFAEGPDLFGQAPKPAESFQAAFGGELPSEKPPVRTGPSQDEMAAAFSPAAGAGLSPAERIARQQGLEQKIRRFSENKADRFAAVIHETNQANPDFALSVEDLNAMAPEHLKSLAEAVSRRTGKKEGIPSPRTLAQIGTKLRKLQNPNPAPFTLGGMKGYSP